jgi:hypothetical protein
MWWNPYTVEGVRLTTSLSVEECRKRIDDNIYSLWRAGANPKVVHALPFRGRVGRDRFTII